MKDRTMKMVAPIEPSEDEMSLDACIEALNDSRTNTLQVLLHTPDLEKYVLHHHRFGDMTANQIFELMVEHELRHVEQIKELVDGMPK
ncbi:DinB family protein [Mangrovibacillus cuniculi]|uniref:DinB family protein n=1 Tax=Mangrovibacillus cuniculi TaxID=2593652 RepID=A0A7S8C9Z7_9BACI|nr:DinB family protein [Mangrovibacillus cuniculi]QPC46092.1 DinB family protein [Mangrovibacillus cuniculi]